MRRFTRILCLLLISANAFGQMIPVTSHYVLNPLTINPAYAGNRGVMNIAAFYRNQWVGISGAPTTMSLAMDAPFMEDKLGLGLVIINDRIDVTKETQFNTNYAYKISLDEGILSLGLGAAVITTNTAWSDLVVIDPGDDYYLIDSRVFVVPNFSFGAYYSTREFFAGLSIPKLLGHKFDFDKNRYTIKHDINEYYFLLNAGYLFDMSKNLKFMPSALVAFSPRDKLLYDINAHFRVYDRFWAGLSYRNNRSLTGMFQFQVSDQLKFAYTYDFDFNKLRTFSSGSHEIMLRYEFRYKVEAISPLNF
ncbi:MAG: type IX secretion system membrane protein PorP/SprF [Bacteroidales bacterium]|jgi:type IX secretion system PorP/SprF family membrane protein